MARLVDVWREDEARDLCSNQMLLNVDEKLTMVMDVKGLKAICDDPVRGEHLDEFVRKLKILTKEEVKASFEVTLKEMLDILGKTVPCVGCRRSVERLLHDLMKSGHPALDPLIFTPDGLLSIKDDTLKSPEQLCTMLHGHSTRLNDLMEQQSRNRKSQRCTLHSLETQRMRPPPYAWREAWECMDKPCKDELALIETDVLDETLDTYLRKNKFCGECRNKVLLASSLLMKEPDPAKEQGYVSVLYTGIKRCIADHHIHLPILTNYIGTIINRAQPELVGRERHAKTLEIAQEEVLTCLGICVADRLHKVHRRLREEETVCKVLAAVAVDALSRSFQTAVEMKQGFTQLELLYDEITKEEIAKRQKREKLRLKRRKQKERRNEAEEKENTCDDDCSSEKERQISDSPPSRICVESKPTTQNIDRHKLQVLDPKNKGLRTCKCPDCLNKTKVPGTSQSQGEEERASSVKKTSSQKSPVKNPAETRTGSYAIESKLCSSSHKQYSREDLSDISESREASDEKVDKARRSYDNSCKSSVVSENSLDAGAAKPRVKSKYPMWINTRKRFKLSEREGRSTGEQSFQDTPESTISSSSLLSTPADSEAACNDVCCKHGGHCLRSTCDKLTHSNASLSLLEKRGGGLTLSQMLEEFDDDDNSEKSQISAEEILEFQSRIHKVMEERQELRQTLRERFDDMCKHKNRK